LTSALRLDERHKVCGLHVERVRGDRGAEDLQVSVKTCKRSEVDHRHIYDFVASESALLALLIGCASDAPVTRHVFGGVARSLE
jgi:hypothetical protein